MGEGRGVHDTIQNKMTEQSMGIRIREETTQ
jgi:hypothetical protein